MVTDSAARRTAYTLVALSAIVWLGVPLAFLVSAAPNIRETLVEPRAGWEPVAIELENARPTFETDRRLFLSIPQLDRLIQHEAVLAIGRWWRAVVALHHLEPRLRVYRRGCVSPRTITLEFSVTDLRVPRRSQVPSH